jgi:hypothetical protein
MELIGSLNCHQSLIHDNRQATLAVLRFLAFGYGAEADRMGRTSV